MKLKNVFNKSRIISAPIEIPFRRRETPILLCLERENQIPLYMNNKHIRRRETGEIAMNSPMNGIKRQDQYNYEITFSADDWKLYPRAENRELVAEKLNCAFESALRSNIFRSDVFKVMIKVMNEYENNGASDNESKEVLLTALSCIFGEASLGPWNTSGT